MTEKSDKTLFWGCFIALITTSYAFSSRISLCGSAFAHDFNLNPVQVGELIGAGIWPFGVSIILFSLIIDRIGYKTAMLFSFVCYAAYTALAFAAYGAIQGVTGDALPAAQAKGYKLLYTASIILALGNGTVEAYINPLVAALFPRDKTKWFNILHAGWPAGLVIGGVVAIGLASNTDWRISLGLILVPAVLFLVILVGRSFPKSEREQAGVGYVDMLKELGAFGALVGFGLIFKQLAAPGVLSDAGWPNWVVWVLTGIVVVLFAVVTRSFGRPILAVLILIMMPLATTEIGTDGWVPSLMQAPMEAAGFNPTWVLVYTAAIMVILRFTAGPIAHKLSPLGLLMGCSVLAIIGLFALSRTGNSGLFAIGAAATLYAVGKSFFWPTMLGVAAEQCPRGGALTLNTVGGIGMLAVGILGFPFIGYLQADTAVDTLAKENPAIVTQVTTEKEYVLGHYHAIDPTKAAAITDAAGKTALAEAAKAGQFGALARMTMFPSIMLLGYIGLFFYFKGRGGYKPVDLTARH